MKKLALALSLSVLAGAASADTLFDSINLDPAGTTPRSNYSILSSLIANKLTGGFFTLGSASSLTDISFLFHNAGATTLTSLAGSLQIYRTVDPNFSTSSQAIAFTDPIFTTGAADTPLAISLSGLSLAKGAIGTGVKTLDTPVNLSAGTYGFTLKFTTTKVAAVATYGSSYGAGSGFATWSSGFLADTSGTKTLLRDSDAFVLNQPNSNLGFALRGTQAVPEPASMTALGLGALAMLRRRKRA